MADASLPPLIQQMLQPDFYPHPVVEPIELIQTHVSYVFLTGDYAYKLKKPVNFGFLDYSTLEKRQHFCQEELRLNQRGAAELYLDVLPITQTGDQFHLEGTTAPVEYVLKMVQFPQENLLLAVFERNGLTFQQMEELGRRVAQFHAVAETNDYIRTFGEISQIRAAFDENYQQTEIYIGGPQTQAQFDGTREYTDRFFATRQSLFADRMAQHFIRECHGDLHLRNICLWHDQILLFDCIEFNEPFRFVDVMYDVAFTIMDLEARQRPDLGNAFLNTYIEQTGDWEGLQLLPLYLSRQAYVRAKVTSFLLNDPAIPEAVKQEATQAAAHYYHLAWNYTKPREGCLVLMTGLSGSGKSTTARNLARRMNGIHIRSDAVRKHLGGIPLQERGGDDLYTLEMSQKTYGRLLELGVALASQGFPVILDAKYDNQPLRLEVIGEAQVHQIPLHILHCTAPMEVLQERVRQRTGDIADATLEVLAQQSMDVFSEVEQGYVRTIDTTQTVDVIL
ncbi:adenylyl-sulfate kinase [Leptolyngbya sp. 'hensonii']|uniref:bifunctional aminoglycoside phosphotransferase/ATP-binding protein n=1 Tax=Leptolyngbya sp. 'hensonii' TaxID=1922337 RepID=UPI00095026AE|nr:AAA family ATPase [Leptolyngbya sp. 'hensonii']OLP20231.1 adenylyl-sulfate kinase [Leptolyngbya sp. 'hensonii']